MSTPMNWKLATDETVTNLARLIQARTVNPPGNELEAILIIKDILQQAGIPSDLFTILEPTPSRANLVARLQGDGSLRPLLLSGHVDVVPVEPDQWSHDPFGGEVINGEIWGRGSLDMKGFLAMYLEIFLSLFRQKIPLKRDVILAAIADEEEGFTYGSKFLVEQHPILIDAEYGFTEGGAVTVHLGSIKWYPIQVAEISHAKLHVLFRGKVGHGSVLQLEGPIFQSAKAIETLHRAGNLPIHLTPTFLKMLDSAASQSRFPVSTFLKMLHSPTLMAFLLRNVMKGHSRDLIANMVTNTFFLSSLQAGGEDVRSPSTAELNLFTGLLPGQTAEDVIWELHQIMGDAPEINVVKMRQGTDFSADTPLYKLLDRRTRQLDPEGVVTPMLFSGITDASQYQKAGITIYGFTPGKLPPDIPIMLLVHGHNERMPLSFIESGLPVLWDVVTEFCGKG